MQISNHGVVSPGRLAPTTLADSFFPATTLVRKTALVLSGAILVSLLAQVSIPLPFTPVPVTGQTLGVLLVGTSLGTTLGSASLLVYLLAGVVGAPVYADGAHGWDVLTGPSGGYLVGFLVASAVTGLFARRRWDRGIGTSVTAMLTGNVVVYLFGLPWLAHSIDTGLQKTLELGLYPFIIGDLIKVYLAASVLPLAWRLVRRFGG